MDSRRLYEPLPLPPQLLALARSLRTNLTDAEQFMWYLLRRKQLGGFRFRRQHPFGPYVLDFYCALARLEVELDGGQHADSLIHDSQRATFLQKRGIAVVRVWNNDVFENIEGVLQMIYHAVLERVEPDGKNVACRDSVPPP